MKQFLTHSLRFATVGIFFFILLMVLYVSLDPFKVLYDYDRFVADNAKAYIVLNRDYVSTKTFDNNYKKEHYNSFIFGNSRSIFYEVDDWYQHIGIDNSAFHFDASSESLYALNKKIKYLDSKGVSIDNALLVVDEGLLALGKPIKGSLYNISPQLLDNKNLISFHFANFKTFSSPKFFIPATYYQVTGNVFPFFKNSLDYRQRVYNPKTNEVRFLKFEKMINDGEFYTGDRIKAFYKRSSTSADANSVIGKSQELLLYEIYEIFKKQGTKYKIIINPLYDQIKINRDDLIYLKKLFDKTNVFDFSGINSFTQDYNNYYDWSHYRPHVSREIMKIIYTNN